MVEFKDSDDLENWLKGKPIEWLQVIASRASLRTLPFVEQIYHTVGIDKEASGSSMVLAFRTCLISWVARKFPAQDVRDFAIHAAYISVDLAVAYNYNFSASSAYFAAASAVDFISYSLAYSGYSTAPSPSAASTAFAAYFTYSVVLSADASLLENGMLAKELINKPLWLDGKMGKLKKEWQNLKKSLLAQNQNWQVWIDWYEDILAGRKPAGLPDDIAEKLYIKIATQENDFWEQDVTLINDKITEWTDVAKKEADERKGQELTKPPAEPVPYQGLQYDIVNEKLSHVAHIPEEDELSSQAGLHKQINNEISKLTNAVSSLGNQFPELINVVKEYKQLVNSDLSDLDIDGVWAVGGSLASFDRAYREQNIGKTMESPLEPNIAAMLQNTVRIHGAFILGFEEGRELVRRADAFTMSPEILAEIEKPGNEVLQELSKNDKLVDKPTRDLHLSVNDALHEFGWSVSRNGYAGFSIIYNSSLSIVKSVTKFLLGNIREVGMISIVASIDYISGGQGPEFARHAIQFLQTYGSQLLALFNHSPEMKAYVEWVLKLLNGDKKNKED